MLSQQKLHNQSQPETNGYTWRIAPLVIADQQQHIEQSEAFFTQPDEQVASLYWSLAEPTGLVLGFSQKHEVLNSMALHGYQFIIDVLVGLLFWLGHIC